MKRITQRLWALFLLILGDKSLAHQPANLDTNYCAHAQTLFSAAQNPLQVFTNLATLLHSQTVLGLDSSSKIGKKRYPQHSAEDAMSLTILDSMFNLSKPAQELFIEQSRLFCRSLAENTADSKERFLTVCHSLGRPLVSTRRCLTTNCAPLLDPNIDFHAFISHLRTVLNIIPGSLRTTLPHFFTCLNLSESQRQVLDKMRWEIFLKLPSLPQFEVVYPDSADSTHISDPLQLAQLLDLEPKQFALLKNCTAVSAEITPDKNGLGVFAQCKKSHDDFSYSHNGKFYSQAVNLLDYYTLICGFFTLLALIGTSWYFWARKPKKPIPSRLETKEIKIQDPEQRRQLAEVRKSLSAAQRELAQSRDKNAELNKEIEKSNRKIQLLENIPLKKLVEIYKISRAIFSQRFADDKNTGLNDFYFMLHNLIAMLDTFNLEPLCKYVNPSELEHKLDFDSWNHLLARTIYAHKISAPTLAEQLSRYYFIPSNFPTGIYQQLHKLATNLGENYRVFIQGSALWNYEKSSDLDLVVHYSVAALTKDEFKMLLANCFSGATITYYQPKVEGMHSYKITLRNGRIIDLCYAPKATPESLPLFTSAEGRLILDGRSGIERSVGFAEFLLANQTQFSSEEARKKVIAQLSALENNSANQEAISVISYALNHLAKAAARGYGVGDDIREVLSAVPGLPTSSYDALCTQISTRYSGNASDIFTFINSLRKAATMMRR